MKPSCHFDMMAEFILSVLFPLPFLVFIYLELDGVSHQTSSIIPDGSDRPYYPFSFSPRFPSR